MATTNEPSPPPVVPRTLAAYHEPGHVGDRFECPRRPIDRDRAARAVERGDVETNPVVRDGRAWRYRLRIDGCDVVVAAADATEPYRDFVLLTAYVDVVDGTDAWKADRWSTDEWHTAALLQYLKSDVRVQDAGISPKNIDATKPVEYGGHRLIHKRGYTVPVCVDCGFETTSGDRYKRNGCR